MAKEQIIFDPSIADYKTEHDMIGSILIDQNADVITSGDGDSDNILGNAINGYDVRSFGYAFDGTNWDRIRMTSGALDVNVASGTITITPEGIETEDTQHVSGTDGSFILAVRDDGVAATALHDTVTFTADVPGTDGNSISLVFDGVDDLDTVVNAWNVANPSNTVSFSGQAGTYVPSGATVNLTGGATHTTWTDANGDYSPIAVNEFGHLFTSDAAVLAQLQSGVVVSATDLDIRDLAFATDKVDVSGSEVSLDAATLAALETVTVEQGTSPWVIGDGGGSITVDAVDLDIRNLLFSQDSVTSYIKDSNGDDLQAYNDELRVADVVNTLANSALTNVGTGAGAGPGAQAIVSSPLANRKDAWLFNNSKKRMYVGASGITAGTGFPFPPGSMYHFGLGAAAVMHVLGTDVGDAQDLRVMEGAA
jgi:hypothetical protein